MTVQRNRFLTELLAEEEKLAFFYFLNDALDIDASALAICARNYADGPTLDGFAELSRSAEPKRQELLCRLNQPMGATTILEGEAQPQDVRAMAARYLISAKREDGAPLDPVARFHLGNGAQIYDIHADADLSANGLRQSGGAMVNDHYDLAQTQRRHAEFAFNATVAKTKPVQTLSTATLTAKPKEATS